MTGWTEELGLYSLISAFTIQTSTFFALLGNGFCVVLVYYLLDFILLLANYLFFTVLIDSWPALPLT
jgi:hypothetical protein